MSPMTAPQLPLSVLDLSPVAAGQPSHEALAATVTVARRAEALGYHRLWVAEHHSSAGLASASPEVLIAHLGAHTSTIRLGAGGVMLPNHAPLRIAEAFRLLEALHPGRIDLGLGRAPGTDHLTAYALRRSREALTGDDYPQLLAELLAYDDGSFPEDHPFRQIHVTPTDVALPPVFLLGSSMFSAELAAQAGLGMAFAAHIGGDTAVPALTAYRRQFSPSPRYAAPYALLAIGVVTADTEAEVAELRHVADLWMLRIIRGEMGYRPSRAEALAYEFSEADRALLRRMPGKRLVGLPDEVEAQIRALVAETQADEVMVMSSIPEVEDRVRTLELLADRFGLVAPGTPAAVAAPERELAGVAE
jgi:luciferase family oxidoreductase group 1